MPSSASDPHPSARPDSPAASASSTRAATARLPRLSGRLAGRYAVYDEIARGGMAVVHLARLLGPAGFARTVAIKRLHAHYAHDPSFVEMFLDEARLVARIRHPNVVPALDVLTYEGELLVAMEYVHGESLARLMRVLRERQERVPLSIALAIAEEMLAGLHAAHEATSDSGEPLELVHRDVSPQNVMVGRDGVARVLDFGIARATGRDRRDQSSSDAQFKGKLAYIAPEQLRTGAVDRRTDVYAAGVTLWEMLTGRRRFLAGSEWQLVNQVLEGRFEPPSLHAPGLPPELDRLLERALAPDPKSRFASARDMAMALESVAPRAGARRVGEWVDEVAGDSLRGLAEVLRRIESDNSFADTGQGAGDLERRAFAPTSGTTPKGSAVARVDGPTRGREAEPTFPAVSEPAPEPESRGAFESLPVVMASSSQKAPSSRSAVVSIPPPPPVPRLEGARDVAPASPPSSPTSSSALSAKASSAPASFVRASSEGALRVPTPSEAHLASFATQRTIRPPPEPHNRGLIGVSVAVLIVVGGALAWRAYAPMPFGPSRLSSASGRVVAPPSAQGESASSGPSRNEPPTVQNTVHEATEERELDVARGTPPTARERSSAEGGVAAEADAVTPDASPPAPSAPPAARSRSHQR